MQYREKTVENGYTAEAAANYKIIADRMEAEAHNMLAALLAAERLLSSFAKEHHCMLLEGQPLDHVRKAINAAIGE